MPTHPAVSHSPESVVQFVRQVIDQNQVIREAQSWSGEERRAEHRESVQIVVGAQALDDDLEPVGEPFEAVTRNLSGGGIGILHDTEAETPYLLITLRSKTGETMDLVTNVRHCTEDDGRWLIGGRFVVRWT